VPSAKRLHYSYEEYLRLLERSPFKLEFCDGIIYALAGGTVTHAALGAAVIRAFGLGLGPGCTVYSSDLKVRIAATDLSTFPDVSVVCGPPITAPEDRNALTNPALVVEVTSRSTEDYDRGDKLSHYKQLPSLEAVLFVSHRAVRVSVVERRGGAWVEREHRSGERVVLAHPAIDVAVDDLYAGIALEPA